jgi:hypothetical protein
VCVAGGLGRCECARPPANAWAHVGQSHLDTYADLFDTDLDAVGVTLDTSYALTTVGKPWAGRRPATMKMPLN